MIGGKRLRRLPVWIVVKRSYLYAWESRHVLGLPYAIYAAITIVAELSIGYVSGSGDSVAS